MHWCFCPNCQVIFSTQMIQFASDAVWLSNWHLVALKFSEQLAVADFFVSIFPNRTILIQMGKRRMCLSDQIFVHLLQCGVNYEDCWKNIIINIIL